MPRRPTDEQLTFHYAVYSSVMEIPPGKVTSYGHIARLIHRPRNARQVGQSLKHFNIHSQQLSLEGDVPWWRVLSSTGVIPKREKHEAVAEQANLLRGEGVEVQTSRLDEYFVDIVEYGWFPQPEAEFSDSEEESDEADSE
ncbi:hypothetical protein CANARDRAFT_232008 [[Candida] arabinofermentans NRRL YB-2248]|uniref:6-O-methylguanine-DNA methyltransferase n=1 Tax=[Candida] arabinofermentans NRRL YB-2248 TaxID=983967 RepID=A0A1E4T3R1_9ASCO|nr:hypothetical protein CANARDRAFT_232008 [[Candida] arabinofermentans NRRL YB-2248]